jgi:restriction endonuclease S subunit
MVTLSKKYLDYKKINNFKLDGENLFIGNIDSGKKFCINYYNGKCDYTNLLSLCKIKKNFIDKINIKYTYYLLLNNNDKLTIKYLKGLAILSLDVEKFNLMKIPIPSLEIQERLIKEIEDINILINLRKNANKNFKKEKEYLKKMINKKIINSNINEFGKIFDLIKGTIQSSKVVEDENGITLVTGAITFKKIQNIHNIKIINGNNLFVSTNGNGDKIPIKFFTGECYYSCLMSLCKIKNNFIDKINIEYIYYYLLDKKEYIEEKYQKGLANKSLDVENFNKMKIYIPSLELQEQFIKDIEELNIKFDKLKED